MHAFPADSVCSQRARQLKPGNKGCGQLVLVVSAQFQPLFTWAWFCLIFNRSNQNQSLMMVSMILDSFQWSCFLMIDWSWSIAELPSSARIQWHCPLDWREKSCVFLCVLFFCFLLLIATYLYLLLLVIHVVGSIISLHTGLHVETFPGNAQAPAH